MRLVTIRNLSAAGVDMNGWRICSIRGNQLHATLTGSIAAGQELVIASQSSTQIWSNNDSDPGALHDANGALVSYWPD